MTIKTLRVITRRLTPLGSPKSACGYIALGYPRSIALLVEGR
jgi:hypothetical protein